MRARAAAREPKPTIAAINGACAGLLAGLFLGCATICAYAAALAGYSTPLFDAGLSGISAAPDARGSSERPRPELYLSRALRRAEAASIGW